MAKSTTADDVTAVDFARPDYRMLLISGVAGVLAAFAVGKLAIAFEQDEDLQRGLRHAALDDAGLGL